jgi:oligopeptide/dipeptide ABC transporter ATP-binding protein
VLHRGLVVEQGDPEQIVKHPQHPYTKLLISSIPQPDPDRPWGEIESDGAVVTSMGVDGTGPHLGGKEMVRE